MDKQKYFFLLFGLVFLGVAIAMFITMVLPEDGTMGWGEVVPIALIGAASLFIFAKAAAKEIKNRLILKTGDEGTGTFVEYHGSFFNNVRLYRIKFTFVGEDGQTYESTTRNIYSEKEANDIAALQTIPIKYKGNTAVIDWEELSEALFRQTLKKDNQ